MASKENRIPKQYKRGGPVMIYKYDEKIGYERIVVNSEIASSERSSVWAFQNMVIGYFKELSREA